MNETPIVHYVAIKDNGSCPDLKNIVGITILDETPEVGMTLFELTEDGRLGTLLEVRRRSSAIEKEIAVFIPQSPKNTRERSLR